MYKPHLYQYDPSSILTFIQLILDVYHSGQQPDISDLPQIDEDQTKQLVTFATRVMGNDDDISCYYQPGGSNPGGREEKINQTLLLRSITQFLRKNTSAEGETTLRHVWVFNCNLHQLLTLSDEESLSAKSFIVVWDDLSQSGMYLDCYKLFDYHTTYELYHLVDIDDIFTSDSNFNKSVTYLSSPDDADRLIRHQLMDLLNLQLSIPSLRKLHSTFEFWSLQLQSEELDGSDDQVTNQLAQLQEQSKEMQFLSFMSTALKTLSQNASSSSAGSDDSSIATLKLIDMIHFYDEVQAQQLTDQSLPMLNELARAVNISSTDSEILTDYSVSDVLAACKHHKNYQQIVTHIADIDDDDIDELKRHFTKDSWYRSSGYDIDSIIKFDMPETRDLKKYPDHFVGIHGTNDESVPSIALNGLMNSDELQSLSGSSRKKLVKYSTSGTALGVGIYFGRLDQISKPLLYANGRAKDEAYIIVADVAYNKKSLQKVKWTSWTGEHNDTASLVWATKTGVRGKDEIVAPITKNIRIKYMLKLKRTISA